MKGVMTMQKIIKRYNKIDFFDRCYFNCFGFAMGIPQWLRLYSWEEVWINDFDEVEDWKESLADVFYDCCEEIEERFDNVRRINKEEDAKRNEIVFFFRLAQDDYHFVMKVGNRYFHKTGGNPTLKEMTKEQVYSDSWCGRYDSDIAIFARKRNGKTMW